MKYILIITVFIFFIISNSLISQDMSRDTLAVVKIKNIVLRSKDSLEFELYIQRNSERWLKFANGTFQLGFANGMAFDTANMSVSLEPYQYDLNKESVTGGDMLPTDGYFIEPKIFKDRISITYLGPPDFDDCIKVDSDPPILLGKFVLATKSGNIPDKLSWLEPQNFYQDCAYKLKGDSTKFGYVTWFTKDDNVPMEDGINVTFILSDDNKSGYNFVHNKFTAEYRGLLNVGLNFQSLSEYRVDGFTIMRGYGIEGQEVVFSDSIFTYKTGSNYYNEEMLSKGFSKTGHSYGELTDKVPYRGGKYFYALHGHFTDSQGIFKDSLLEITSCDVMNAVIISAVPAPAIFSERTKIMYELDDDVYLTVKAFDFNGKFIKYLPKSENIDDAPLNHTEMKKGNYTTTFNAPELASQGIYKIMFTAVPIDDPTVEISNAYVDVRLVKGYKPE